MIDYKLLHALALVVECGGFERAGEALGLSQSAVSQRIKTLEVRLGQPVLARQSVPRATPAGQRLLNHYHQVRLLERDLSDTLPALAESTARVRIAINADSLATWWGSVVGAFCRESGLLMDLVIEDQDVGLRRMREGDVAACLCSSDQPIVGARCVRVGTMRYRPLASPDYMASQFPSGVTVAAFGQAPAIVFGPNDQLQHRFMADRGYTGPFPHHLCPSSEGFVRLALAGMGYGMIPESQVTSELEAGALVRVDPTYALDVPLYWHYWRHSGDALAQLTDRLQDTAIR
ncbi:LysR family transcriptional regulator (chromosome initiation inhibitor) [Tamilnaduibacter salinus]|uniref:ArgP/LysG family DNA-binding transcriptional regulator n=1 Tax=Tamilnaduibacter salinus TaxID=1484056 RepID=A0A2A2I659_9GAMM|nr:LysR family transcriptional regulator ArgP [Tamilnaduibacter salinus]PAV26615.1 ArgP/LysG family DNA-binding transcriptional regulator [Tamilnaduibacter salinus]PVY75839.1 LysR family transcriptional regulator (chromosome initiation inhibitor) [Tamilnaduibacter salinus]